MGSPAVVPALVLHVCSVYHMHHRAKKLSSGTHGCDIFHACIRRYPFTRAVRLKQSFVHVSARWPGGAGKSHAQLQVLLAHPLARSFPWRARLLALSTPWMPLTHFRVLFGCTRQYGSTLLYARVRQTRARHAVNRPARLHRAPRHGTPCAFRVHRSGRKAPIQYSKTRVCESRSLRFPAEGEAPVSRRP